MDALKEELAAVAARLVVEEGLEYGAAKRRAIKQMGLPARTALPLARRQTPTALRGVANAPQALASGSHGPLACLFRLSSI